MSWIIHWKIVADHFRLDGYRIINRTYVCRHQTLSNGHLAPLRMSPLVLLLWADETRAKSPTTTTNLKIGISNHLKMLPNLSNNNLFKMFRSLLAKCDRFGFLFYFFFFFISFQKKWNQNPIPVIEIPWITWTNEHFKSHLVIDVTLGDNRTNQMWKLTIHVIVVDNFRHFVSFAMFSDPSNWD